MSYRLHDSPFLFAPKLLDARRGPWDDTAQAIATVPEYCRAKGLTVAIKDNGSIVEYWWKDGITDGDLVQKFDPYEHPTGFSDKPDEELSGNTVISQVEVNEEGHVTGVKVRDLGSSLEWNELDIPYKTNTTILDLSTLLTGEVTSIYMCVTALFGVKHYTPGKKVSMVATRISEFAVHETADGAIHGADVKTQYTGVYAKYADSWDNTPAVLMVRQQDIKIFIEGSALKIYHEFDKDENIEPLLKCRYRIDIQKLIFDG